MNINSTIEAAAIKAGKSSDEVRKITFDGFALRFKEEVSVLRKWAAINDENLKIYEQRLFSKELENLREGNFDIFINEVIVLYYLLSFFPKPEIVQRFRELGFSKNALKWFVSLELILKEIERINNLNDIRIEPDKTIYLVQHHLFFKITNSILLDANVSGPKRSGTIYNQTHNGLVDFFKRSDYAKKMQKTPICGFDVLMSSVFQEIEEVGDKKINTDVLLSIQGKTEKNVLGMILQDLAYWTCSDRKAYLLLFDFFKLLLPDSSFLSEEEFMSGKHSAGYDGKYDNYRYITLKKILNSTKEKLIS